MRRVLSEADLREFRDRVCAAAAELLAEQGYDGFNMRELAARLGVSAMTTYRYFDGKNEIFAALRIQAINSLANRLESFPNMLASPLERVVAFCHAYVDFAREEPVRYRIMFDYPQPRIARSADLDHAERRLFEVIAERARLFAHNGRPAGRELLARNLWASLHGLASLTSIGTFHKTELDGLIRDMIDRIAGQRGRPAGFEHETQDSATEWQPSWTDYTNGAPANLLPVAAAK
jgi:AcrR family transcriptional regulator